MARLSKSGRQSKGQGVKKEPPKCPMAEETGCAKTFSTIHNANRHADSVHRRIRYPCPIAEETRCTKTFSDEEAANRHADSVHRGITHLCPMAEETGCTKTFRSKQAAKNHADSIHCGKTYLCRDCQKKCKSMRILSQHQVKAHGAGMPCPRAKEFNCNRRFPDRGLAKEHLDYDHLGITYPCPLKDEFSCDARFKTEKSAKSHVDTHSKPTISCPYAKECGCKKKFYTPTGARTHAEAKHKGIQHPCPMAAKFKCDKVYTTKSNASQHALVVHVLRGIPCPALDGTVCSKRFLSITGAQRHVQSAHKQPVKCPGHEGKQCDKTFTNKVTARCHAQRAHGKRWMCTVPMCRLAVTRQTLPEFNIFKHMTQHKKFGHLDGLDTYPWPIEVYDDGTPWEGAEDQLNLDNDIDEDGDENGDMANEDEECNEVDEERGEVNDLDGLSPTVEDENDEYDYIVEDEDPTSSDSFLSTMEMIMEDIAARERSTRERNEVILRQHPDIQTRHRNFGLHCLGPGVVVDGMMVTKLCPRGTIIGLDTARLKWCAKDGSFSLAGRCLSCYTECRFNECIQSLGLAGADGQIVCGHGNCVKPTWCGTQLCKVHIWNAKPGHSFENRDDISILQDLLQKAASRQWILSPKVQEAMRIYEKILAREMPPGMLRFLDLEYSPVTGRVHEVGMCDAMGNVTMDCFTQLSDAELKRTSSSNVNYLGNMISTLHVKAITGHQHSQATKTAHQIATQLSEEGVTPETIVVVWATNWSDVRFLREWLEAEGYSDIFPPNSRCVTMVHAFWDNLGKLPNGKKFPTSLPVLFPLLYGTSHELYGRNHHALADTLQLRLMFQALQQLCRPLSDRERRWQVPDDAGIRQKKLVDYWPKLSKRKGNDDINDPKEDITVVDNSLRPDKSPANTSGLHRAARKRRRA